MHAAQRPTPYDPSDYVMSHTYFDLIRGMVAALRRWDEIDPTQALELVAYFHEGIDLQERSGEPVFAASSPQKLEAEHRAAILAAVDVIKRADASGLNARGIIAQLRPHMRGEVAASVAQFKRAQQQKPTSFLGGLFGR